MTRGGSDAKRRLGVLLFSWLLVVSVGGASVGVGVAGVDVSSAGTGADVESAVVNSSAVERDQETIVETTTGTTAERATTTESPRSLDPAFHFACEQVAVTARGYDSVTLVFADGDRQTFRWTFRGRNVFFGTGESVGAVVSEVVVRRDGERVVRRNPNVGSCAGRTATGAPTTISGTVTASGGGITATTVTTLPTLDLPTVAETVATANETNLTATDPTATTTNATVTNTTATNVTVDTATATSETNATVTAGTTVRETTPRTATVVPTPTVTPYPIAGYPECADEEVGLTNVLSLRYENGSFTSENATEVGENRFLFTAGGEAHEIELVEVERNDAGRPVSVAFDATLAVDAVVVRAGPGANVYEFPEGVSRRSGLHAPTNGNTGQPFAIEGIAFCDDPDSDSETPTRTETENGSLGWPGLDLGLGFLVGRDAAAAVGLAAAGLLVARRRRSG